MRYQAISSELFIKNRNKLISRLKPNSLVVIFSSNEMPRNGDQTFPFRQDSDFFYLTGLDQERSILLLYPDNKDETMRDIAFIIKTNETMVTWNGHKYTQELATELSGIKNIKWLDDFESIFRSLIVKVENVYLKLDENTRFVSEVQSKNFQYATKIKNDFPLHNYHRLTPLLVQLRLIKEPEEINIIKQACSITDSAFRKVLSFLKPNIYEYEVEAKIISEFIRSGANGHAYAPIVASGVNNCVLHYNQNNMICKSGDLLLLDFGAEYANYASDLSRTIPVNGKFSKRQKQVYNSVLKVMRNAIKLMKPGATINFINKTVTQLIEKELVDLNLITLGNIKNQDANNPAYFKYYMHGASHFIGLDVHDVGDKDIVLEKGMILSCEPGIYIKEEGFGVRIENDIMVDNDPIDLMNNIPIEADEIEELMIAQTLKM